MLIGRGAQVVHGPVTGIEPVDRAAALDATEAVLASPLDVVVVTTAVGLRTWFAVAEDRGLDDALRSRIADAVLLTRGEKSTLAARALGLQPSWIAASDTTDELLQLLVARGVRGLRVAVQRDGGRPHFAEALASVGAKVLDVPIYRWVPAEDGSPAQRLLDLTCAGAVDALTFTSSYAVHTTFALAAEPELLQRRLRHDVLAVAVGSITAAALAVHGVDRVVVPGRWRLEAMVDALAAALAGPASAGRQLAVAPTG
jgi:uroporphyrinogen-III synthase